MMSEFGIHYHRIGGNSLLVGARHVSKVWVHINIGAVFYNSFSICCFFFSFYSQKSATDASNSPLPVKTCPVVRICSLTSERKFLTSAPATALISAGPTSNGLVHLSSRVNIKVLGGNASSFSVSFNHRSETPTCRFHIFIFIFRIKGHSGNFVSSGCLPAKYISPYSIFFKLHLAKSYALELNSRSLAPTVSFKICPISEKVHSVTGAPFVS